MISSVERLQTESAALRGKIPFNESWQFRLGAMDAEGPWRALDLPHDWGVESGFDITLPAQTGKLRWWGKACYRKGLRLAPDDRKSRYLLEIGGAMSHAVVWVNGRKAGGWAYGYTGFHIDITDHLAEDAVDNTITIELDNPPDSSRWYPGGGIYRNVWLHKTGRVHVAPDSLAVATRELAPDHSNAKLDVVLEIENTTGRLMEVRVEVSLEEKGAKGFSIVNSPDTGPCLKLPARSLVAHSIPVNVAMPRVWTVHTEQSESPPLYMAVIAVKNAETGALLDQTEVIFGIRTARFDSKSGFHLNHSTKPTRIQGVCLHHDLGPLGAAAHPDAIARQLSLLKELGCNAIRCAHNPPAPALLDLCDRMGFLVMNELCDSWLIGKKPNGYQTLFDDWVRRDLKAMVRRARSHPSVILWSIGNEIPEQTAPDGPALANRLAAIVREEDPERRPVTGGMNIPESGFNGWQNSYDVFGYNYKPHLYAEFRKNNPGIPVLGAETASTASTRSEYVFPLTHGIASHACQVSSYDLYGPPWATTPDEEFAAQDANAPAVAGEFVWTGFDYLGEPTPFNDDPSILLNATTPAVRSSIAAALEQLAASGPLPARSAYYGIFDLCGFPKDRYYLYQARWRPDLPMAHILPHWDWPERVGQNTPVFVYSSGDEAELFLNGTSLGVRRRDAFEYRFRWDTVIYEPGELRVCVRKNNRVWAEAIRRTTGPAARIKLQADYFPAADVSSLVFVTARITDADGQLSPRAQHALRFELPSGSPIRLLATDNGDPTRLVGFQSPDCPVFNGLALAILRLPETWPIMADHLRTLTVTSPDAHVSGARLTMAPSPKPDASPALFQIP